MKKWLIITVIICLSICGCDTNSTTKPQINNLNFTVHGVIDNTEYMFNATTEDNEIKLSVVAPKRLENFKLSYKNDSIKFNYLDLEKEIPLKDFEEDSVFKILLLGFENALNSEAMSIEDDNYFIKFNVDKAEYKMFFSQSGLPLKIVDKDLKREILFKGITILN